MCHASEFTCGCHHHTPGRFGHRYTYGCMPEHMPRHFPTKEEVVSQLEEYLKQLKEEVQEVEEQISEFQKN